MPVRVADVTVSTIHLQRRPNCLRVNLIVVRTSICLILLIAALAFSLASAGNNKQSRSGDGVPPVYGGGNNAPVQTQPMAETQAYGLWKSSFGAVKLEANPARPGTVRGVWIYERNGQEVVGYFAGGLSGNTLSFSWEEPTSTGAALGGGGYLVFDPSGQSFQGKWWTTNRDRGGNWSGWRNSPSEQPRGPAEAAPKQPDADPTDVPPPPPDPASDEDFI